MTEEATSQEKNYELCISRQPSHDFLEDAQGAVLQAQVEAIARELATDYALRVYTHTHASQPTLLVRAPDPEPLHVLADTVMLRYGHELPDLREVPPGADQLPLSGS